MRTDTTLARSFAAWSTIVRTRPVAGHAVARVSRVVVALFLHFRIEREATQGRQRCCVVGVRVVLVVVFHGLALGVGQEAQVVVVQAHVRPYVV
ncbi:hypothetical protein IOC62_17880 [Delftia sp. SD083]|uniref:hypothetical protein n=1 Tax=Delftia sp. SD018 TaxID=2781389 RepID=UPI001A97BD35|nr:hypothetical protein [Delftia sp. SD018]MBO0989388.1 hypothetical protein [Delftia sp. SD083]